MSRRQQIIDSYGGAQGISRLPREQQQQIYYQLVDAANADALEANQQAEKEAKGSLGQDLLDIGASLAGMYAGSKLGGAMFGGGAASSAPAAPVVLPGTGYAVGGGGTIGGSGAALGSAGAANTGAMGLGSLASSALPIAGAAAGAALIGKGAYDMYKGNNDKSALGLGSRASLAIATGGLSEVGKGLGLFGQKSTKQYQKERWGDLRKKGIANIDAVQQANHGGGDTWKDGKYAGQKWSFDKAQDLAKEDPTHFQHVLGNYQAGGDQYAKLSDAQQKEFTRQMVAAGNYKSDKGDVLAKDNKKAQEILQNVLTTMQDKPAATQSNQGSPGRRPEKKQQQKKKKTEESATNLSKLWGLMK
jgi:hypothetical protein